MRLLPRPSLDHHKAAPGRRDSIAYQPLESPMPSVRVKRSVGDYAVLPDGRPRSGSLLRGGLTNLFQRSAQPESAPETTSGRPRAATSASQWEGRPASIIQQYCTQGRSAAPERRNSRPLSEVVNSPVEIPASKPGRIVAHAHDGMSLELVMDPSDVRGAVGSALSLRSGDHIPPKSDLTEPEAHHHDEVVEHLSVIDNHISTVSNLSNVSNTIIIPNLPIYNRRPVVTLPRLAEDDVAPEKGKKLPKDTLDRHVEDVLTNRRKIRRALNGFWGYITTPMGFISFLYGFACAFWGAAIVIFLAKIINLHNEDRQGFWVEVSSQVENALFTVTGVGLIPWRVIDTYRIAKIWHYRQVTRRLRRNAGLPALIDGNDLPDPVYNPNYVHVLSDRQQEDLHYQQQKFMASQTWYRPHETETHKAFPIKTALFICLFIDFNSVFQCMLCGCMWGLNRFQRPAWTTGTLIPASFLCGIGAAILIWRGGNQTRKIKEVEQRLREALDMESKGIGIAGYTGVQPTGEEFAVVSRPSEGVYRSPRSPASPGGTAKAGVASAALAAVPTSIGQAANADPAVLVPAAPQPVVSGFAPHPGLVDSISQAGEQDQECTGSIRSSDGTLGRESRLNKSVNSLREGPSSIITGSGATAPHTPAMGADKLPLLNERR